jgi:hypothetical protein
MRVFERPARRLQVKEYIKEEKLDGIGLLETIKESLTIGILQTGYHSVHASSQDKEHDVHPRAATCPAALDPVSLPRWAPTLPRTPQLQTSPPCRGGLQRHHVSHSPGPCLPNEEGSDAAACPMTLDLTSQPRRAPALPHVPQLRTPPP